MHTELSTPTTTRMKTYRAKLRASGLRPVQIWVPDVRNPAFAAEARRQSVVVSRASGEQEIADFIEDAADFSEWK